jgi:hypothetical protein
MYLCQCIERQLATLLATKYGPGVRQLTQSQYDELLRSLFKQTLGTLLRHLRESAKVSGNLESDLAEVLKYRNWLAHNYFWERAGHFMTDKGCLFMARELQEIIDFLGAFEDQLGVVLEEWIRQNGVSKKMIEDEMEKLSRDIVNDL